MIKRPFYLIGLFLFLALLVFNPAVIRAEVNSFVTIVNPVRGQDFWDLKDQNIEDAVSGQMEIIKKNKVSVTWLIRFDALINQKIIDILDSNQNPQELGLFLEITPSWAKEAAVSYHQSKDWHDAGSVFLSGYSPKEREQFIDASFSKFKEVFKSYPKSVGAWWIDAYSMDYMHKKYGIASALIVSDQYTTDNYQIWGQYFSTPYYPSQKSILTPAQSLENKLPVVIVQWAPRDPLNGYGKVVEDSTYSVQPNDYIDYHNLGIDYFSSLLDVYTRQQLTSFNQLVVGLENSYSWDKYKAEYENQIRLLQQRQSSAQLTLVTMSDFASWYKKSFPGLSPTHIIEANDPLGSEKKVVWFMNPFYRVGWFYNQEGSVIRDIRQYVDGQEEICFKKACQELNFATFPTRVLDDVTYGKKWILDRGKINNFQILKIGEKIAISYTNEALVDKKIEFLPRDISVDDKIKTIDETILNVLSNQPQIQKNNAENQQINIVNQYAIFAFSTIKFVLFILIVIILPGYILVSKVSPYITGLEVFLSTCIGFVFLTLISYLTGMLHISWTTPLIFFCLLIFNIKKFVHILNWIWQGFKVIKEFKLEAVLIFSGIIFQGLTVFKSGWLYDFGIGFWGPTGHDGIWHQALINQLIKNIPPQNPIFSGQILSNYHYFYDLLVAQTVKLSGISILDLLYRFYPFIFSILLGIGTLLLTSKLFKNRLTSILSLYLVYFAGSFGWIVEYIRERHLGGESAFWVNQPVSTNLNPPFAISLILMIAFILIINLFSKSKFWKVLLIILLAGSLIEFKAYAGIIVLLSLGLLSLYKIFRKQGFELLISFIGSLILSMIVFLPQNSAAASLLVFSPFWFINSMIDFPDRVGWFKLADARNNYLSGGKLTKFAAVEILSFTIFLLGNLGMRFVAIFCLIKLATKKFWQNDLYILLFFIGFFSFFIPVIFIQKGNPWNTIQFMYYFLYIAAVFAASSYSWLIQKSIKIFKPVVLIIFLILTPINAITTFRSGLYPNPASRLPANEYRALQFLSNQPKGVVLTNPYDVSIKQYFKESYPLLSYDTTAYVSAFSGHDIFIEDEIQQEILQTDYRKRLVEAKEFFRAKDSEWAKTFLLKNDIKYIYHPKVYGRGLNEDMLGVKNIFENEDVIIYQNIII